MLTANQIRDYRDRKGLSLRDVAPFTGYSFQYLGDLETGREFLNDENYKKFMDGINKAATAKANGELEKKTPGRKPKVVKEAVVEETPETPVVEEEKAKTPPVASKKKNNKK